MDRIKKSVSALLLALTFVLRLGIPALAADQSTLEAAAKNAAAYVYQNIHHPQVGSTGGEWAVLGLARSGYDVPDTYYQDYYAMVESYVKACQGVLHEKKLTEYARVIVALSAIGKDARAVAGYDLTKPLADYDKTIWQGINGPIWALIALDSAGYPMPEDPGARTQATRQMYVERILACQLPDGGWSLAGDGTSDPDITGMTLQALAKYQDQPAVAGATEKALVCLSAMQDADGGYGSWNITNSESVVQVLVALTELGISLEDPRFVKGGNTVLDNLLTYQQEDGSFLHTGTGGGANQLATEQGLYGLAAALRVQKGQSSLYRMGDALSIPDAAQTGHAQGAGLEGKHPDVRAMPITAPGVTFRDIASSPNIAAIESLAAREIITGKDGGVFDPDAAMTRAEFTSIVVKALGLTPASGGSFHDIHAGDWYAGYVGTAYAYGIVTGTTDTTFTPGGVITRQEAAVMAARCAQLCGLDTEMDTTAIRNMLSQFPDYTTTAPWARPALAFCYQAGILDQADLNIYPHQAITRGEVAQMMFNLLDAGNLL